tara:strand:+ start:372 stop:560 length:189 start_codon:yes stop_codon:yes gene_type:complete
MTSSNCCTAQYEKLAFAAPGGKQLLLSVVKAATSPVPIVYDNWYNRWPVAGSATALLVVKAN